MCSVVVLSNHGDSTLDPVRLGMLLLDWQHYIKHEVGRVTRRRKCSETLQCFVQWTRVNVTVIDHTCLWIYLLRFEPNLRHTSEQHFWERLS